MTEGRPADLEEKPAKPGSSALQAATLIVLIWTSWQFYEDGDFLWVLALGAAIHATILWLAAWRFGRFDARFVLLAVSGLYPFTPVVDIVVLDNTANFDTGSTAFVLLLCLSFFASFYVFASADWSRAKRVTWDPVDAIDLRALTALMAVALVIYAVMFQGTIGFSHNYTRGEIYKLDTSSLAAMRFVMQAGMLVMIATLRPVWVAAGERVVPFVTALPRALGSGWLAAAAVIVPSLYFAIDLLVLGDRRFVVTFALAAAVIIAPRRVPIVVVVSAAACIVLLFLYGVLRDRPVSEWLDLVTLQTLFASLNPNNLEFAYFSHIADELLATAPSGYPGFFDALQTAVPRILYPDRPLGFGEWFVSTYHTAYWEQGGGLAGNIVIETFLDWDIAGPAILGGVLGAIFAATTRVGPRHRLAQGFLIFALAFVMRFDLATLVKTTALTGATIGLWIVFASRPSLSLFRFLPLESASRGEDIRLRR
jgi:hypothetical protein